MLLIAALLSVSTSTMIANGFSLHSVLVFMIIFAAQCVLFHIHFQGYSFHNYDGKPHYWTCAMGYHPEYEYALKEDVNTVPGIVLNETYPQGIYRYCPSCGRMEQRIITTEPTDPFIVSKDYWAMIDVDRYAVLAAHHLNEWIL